MHFTEEQSKEIAEFIQNYNTNLFFKDDILDKYYNKPDDLSILEIYTLEEILREGEKNYFIKYVNNLKKIYNTKEITMEMIIKNYGYDSKNEVLTESSDDIKKTLTNLLFGQLIFDMLNLKKFESIKLKQKEPGMIANIDKSILIEELQRGFNYDFKNVDSIVNKMYEDFIRFGGLNSNYFKEFLKYNTNISFEKITNIKSADISYQKRK